jgi:hypothetical protein
MYYNELVTNGIKVNHVGLIIVLICLWLFCWELGLFLGCLGEYKDGEFHILAIIFDDVIG